MRSIFAGICLAALSLLTIRPDAQASTMDQVKNNGFVKCGVTDRIPGFSMQNPDGKWGGFFVDFCRAAAAAAVGSADAISVDSYWLDALEGREVDVLHAGSTWTYTRDTKNAVEFPAIYFYDGQGFIANTGLGVSNLSEAMKLKDVPVCAINTTSTAMVNLQDFIKRNGVQWDVVPIQTMEGMWRAFFGGRCQMAIHDRSALSTVHAGRMDDSADYVVFPEVISKEPLALAVRDDDAQWRDFNAWLVMVTIAAEEYGVSRKNVDEVRASTSSPEIRRLLGLEPGLGTPFGLDDRWAYRVIKQVGNYADIFNANIGPDTRFKMQRGLNKLWSDGGLLYAPPVR
ncbi:transporter substrate-binding domain-containing protein [Magnetovibrio sp. PR-2]|uniref:transporter substrate-binding domain-containing protein n=1 Tax=Magnetovibrio sp. PR-2 TaxID=3120356 RepID=UPI002FCDE47D